MSRRKVRSTDEAMAIHETWNARLLHNARVAAVRIYVRDGEWDTQRVAAMLEYERLLDPSTPDEAERRIMGCVCAAVDAIGRVWVKTGRRADRANAKRNVHKGADPVHVWTARSDADLTEWAEFRPRTDRPATEPVAKKSVASNPVTPARACEPPLDELKHYVRLAILQGNRVSDEMTAYLAMREKSTGAGKNSTATT